ncbi:Maf-like protein YceF [Thalassovita gelatinovora]|uniref:Nucleoside triphosphate pyrophosphatase n=1 Tax=Thalassovita gelatinovora TaxID=53501 RepID=A0A0P1FAC0_THAGE|nr:Maf family nucleotide pyrophosphatase [Thalassovita gelatinovora]QIZ81052.1 septum formation protein Maf [Thalassovita gelatinovora]CUH64991.1 Maf-like protein YceF [Thalassovita gelatinovora]SEP88318.1 septum formation protein [Thalassovita gelatinovora]
MADDLILASGSEIRQNLLRNANVPFRIEKPRIDEEMVKASLLAEDAKPRDIADTLAEMKALKISEKFPDALVIGCDQVLDFNGLSLSKPSSKQDACTQLQQLRGERHMLLSAAVICQAGKPIWRHIGQVRLRMRDFSDDFLDGYLDRNWPEIGYCVGGYKLEEEGVRLFSRVDGDYFTVLGLPLLELLSYLTLRGELQQ